MHAYNIDSNLPTALPQGAPVSMPWEVRELIAFLRGARRLGSQVAFWRSKGKHRMLDGASSAMRSEILGDGPSESGTSEAAGKLRAYEELLGNLELLIESIPFNNKVGLLRRNLISTYQQVFVLRHLCHAVVCRLRMQVRSSEPVGSDEIIASQEALNQIRKDFQSRVPSWDRDSWDVYDHF